MALADYKIRIIANACITRHTRGEQDITLVVKSYSLQEVDEVEVFARIYELKPELKTE